MMKKRRYMMFFIFIFILFLFPIKSSAATTGKRDWKWPVPSTNKLSSCYLDGRGHYALDIYTGTMGNAVYASYPGQVIAVNTSCTHNYGKQSSCGCGGGLGNYIFIRHSYNGVNYVSRYGHLTNVNVSVGNYVTKDTVIGTVGSTGYSMGFHLDFRIYQGSSTSHVASRDCVDPFKQQFLAMPSGLNAGGATTQCCYTYVDEVKKIYATPLDLPAPTISNISVSGNKVTLSWGAVSGSVKYNIQLCNGDWSKSWWYATTSTSFTWDHLDDGVWEVRVGSESSSGDGKACPYRYLSVGTPGTPSITNVIVDGSNVTIKWNSCKNTIKYNIQLCNENWTTSEWFYTGATSYTFSNLPAGTWHYRVGSANTANEERFDGYHSFTVENPLSSKSGWRTENGCRYYYVNGAKVTGWRTIGGYRYYFSKSSGKLGQMLTGWQLIGGRIYYFSKASGKAGRMLTGWAKIGNYMYYFSKSSGKLGQMLTGWQSIGGHIYYFSKASEKAGSMLTGWQSISGHTYYFSRAAGKAGRMFTGWRKINGYTYYFSRAKSTFGRMLRGYQIISGHRYYFNLVGQLVHQLY